VKPTYPSKKILKLKQRFYVLETNSKIKIEGSCYIKNIRKGRKQDIMSCAKARGKKLTSLGLGLGFRVSYIAKTKKSIQT
jgi:hypothetical protein